MDLLDNILKPLQRASNRILGVFEESKTKLYPSVMYHNILFFNITYYTCVTPFCLRNSDCGIYRIHTYIPQQVLTGILHLITVVHVTQIPIYLAQDKNFQQQSVLEKPQKLIKIITPFLNVLYYLTAIYIFWMKNQILEKLWNVSSNKYKSRERNTRTNAVNISVVFLFILMTIFNVLTWNWNTLIVDAVVEASGLFYLQSYLPMKTGNDTFKIQDFGAGMISLGIFQRIVDVYTFHIRISSVIIILISAIQVYHCCKGFYNFLKSETKNIPKVWRHYINVREVTNVVNDFIGKLLPIFVLHLLFICLDRPIAVLSENFLNIMKTYCLITFCVIIFIIAADGHSRMNHLKEWLFKYKIKELTSTNPEVDSDTHHAEEVYEILKWDSETTNIGLGCQLFTLTYGFLALFISICATYGAIQLQFYNAAYNSEVNA